MEQFNPNTLEGTLVNPEQSDRQEALLRRWDSKALQWLEDLWDVEATRDVVSSLASHNPLFAENLWSLQNTIWTSFMREMSRGNETQNEGTEIQEDVIDYFSLDAQQIWELQGKLSEVWLDIFQLLASLKEHIETQLADLPEEYKEKIRNSIGRKTGNISELVAEMKEESTSGEDFKNKRWMLDEKIGNAYNFYTTELFPTLEVKLTLARGETIPERFSTPIRQAHTPNGTEYTTINEEFTPAHLYMEEIDELLNAPLDSDGNFDEGFFSTQNLLSSNNEVHNALFEEMNITKTENISLLSEEDKEIQQNAMIAYFILIGVQMIPYLGAPISLWVDGVDTFSSHDGTLELGKSLWMIDESFQMEKQWYDNALWGVWLALTAVWLQGIAKWKKLANSFTSLEKIGFWRIEEMLQIFGNKLWISQERLNGITEYLRSLFKWDIDEASNGGKVDNVDRTPLEEDLPRENLRLREINQFQELSPEQIWRVNKLLQEVIQNMKYNSFEKIDKLFSHYFANKRPWYSLQDAFKELDLSKVDFDEWSNCVWMSLELQRRLAEEWIDARLVRFDAGWLINNDYVVNGHSALVIPYMKDGQESFIFADPWLMIRQNLAFTVWENSDEIEIAGKTYRILAEGTEDLPYTLQIWDKRLLFDPHNEWINPAETLNMDIMRAIWDYKIVKQNPPGRPTVFKLDIQEEIIRLSSNNAWVIDIPLEDFIRLDQNSDEYKAFEVIIRELWEDPTDFYTRTTRIIEHLWEYREQIWSPSTRELVNNQ